MASHRCSHLPTHFRNFIHGRAIFLLCHCFDLGLWRTPSTAFGKGLIWPYTVTGIIMVGLVVGSIHPFTREVHYDNVVRTHITQKRQTTFDRTIMFEQLQNTREPWELTVPVPKLTGHRYKSHHHYHRPHHRHRPIHDTISALTTPRRPRLLVMR